MAGNKIRILFDRQVFKMDRTVLFSSVEWLKLQINQWFLLWFPPEQGRIFLPISPTFLKWHD